MQPAGRVTSACMHPCYMRVHTHAHMHTRSQPLPVSPSGVYPLLCTSHHHPPPPPTHLPLPRPAQVWTRAMYAYHVHLWRFLKLVEVAMEEKASPGGSGGVFWWGRRWLGRMLLCCCVPFVIDTCDCSSKPTPPHRRIPFIITAACLPACLPHRRCWTSGWRSGPAPAASPTPAAASSPTCAAPRASAATAPTPSPSCTPSCRRWACACACVCVCIYMCMCVYICVCVCVQKQHTDGVLGLLHALKRTIAWCWYRSC